MSVWTPDSRQIIFELAVQACRVYSRPPTAPEPSSGCRRARPLSGRTRSRRTGPGSPPLIHAGSPERHLSSLDSGGGATEFPTSPSSGRCQPVAAGTTRRDQVQRKHGRFSPNGGTSRTSRRSRAAARSTSDHSRASTTAAGRSRRRAAHAPCGRGAAASCSISTRRMRSPPCRSVHSDRRSASAFRRSCSTQVCRAKSLAPLRRVG